MTDVKQKIHVGYYNGFLKIVTDVKLTEVKGKIHVKVFPFPKIGDG